MLVFKVLIDNTIGETKNWLGNLKELIGLEIFNLFNNQNAITNTWVRDVYSKMSMPFLIMTSQVFNIKLNARLAKHRALFFLL
jgi:hypothetical protein